MQNHLPTWTVQRITADVTPPPAIPPVARAPEPDANSGQSRLVLAGVGGVLVLGLIGFALLGGGSDDPSLEQAGSEVPGELALVETTIGEGDQATEPTDAPGTTAGDEAGESDQAEEINDGDRRAIFSAGIVYLQGAVPSEEVGNEIARKAGLVVGPDNVRNEYVIDPTVHFDPSAGAPLYVTDYVLFAPNSSTVGSEFIPLLDLGVILLQQNPKVTIEVIGHTDSVGSAESNLLLSQDRVNSVLAYWYAAGIDPERITAVGKGEAEPIADNSTPDGKQINRRVEFIITGLLLD